MAKIQRRIWQTPWAYSESISTVGALVAVGFLLQVVVGEFDFYLLVFPTNLFAASLFISISILLGMTTKYSHLSRWLCGTPMCVTLIAAFTLLCVIMGLIPQTNEPSRLLGLDVMTRHWAFVLVYVLIMLSLGGVIVRKFHHFKWRYGGFYLNHLGLWLFLLSAGLGYADMERYIMHVQEDETEWRVYDERAHVKELPIAITLHDFDMDYYPPQLAIIDKATGDVLPKDKPQLFQIGPKISEGTLLGWHLQVEEYLHQAVRNSDSTYRAASMPGAAAAVKISATKNGVTRYGWVCGGNQAQLFMTLPLDSVSSMVMTVADPRVFYSHVEVYTKQGANLRKTIEVNKPLRTDGWTVYQYGYDNGAGRLSSYSSFELVYDIWLVPVYIGIIFMMLGAFTMIWQGKTRKEEHYDVA